MKKVIAVAVLIFAFQILFAGVVKDMTGSVDVLINGKWQKAALNMEIKDGTKIMTGLNSTVKVETAGGFFTVNELSMVTYQEILSDKFHAQKLALNMGKVKVRFSKIQGTQSSFKVQTPKGTASVLGSEEDVSFYSSSGMNVDIIDGTIDVGDNNGNSFTGHQGDHGGVSGDNGINGNTDHVSGGLNQFDSFGDDDTRNNTIDNGLKGFLNNLFNQNSLPEPERL